MMHLINVIRRDTVLSMVCWAVFIFGTFTCSAGIFQSLIAVTVFGISDSTYSALLIVGLVVSVSSAIGVGIITDQRPSRKIMALAAAGTMVAGGLLVLVAPSTTSFILAHMLLFPVSGTIFGQLFAISRLRTATLSRADRDGILAIIRAIFALPFVVVLLAWGAAFDAGLPLLTIYPAVIIVGAMLLALVAWRWPADALAPWVEQKSGLGFRASIAEMAAGPVLVRVMLIGAIHAGSSLTNITLALLFAQAQGRGTQDVALFFAIFVLIEIVVTLLIGQIRRYLRRLHIIAIGVFLYAVYMALIPALVNSPSVWWLVIPAGAGGAMVYALAIGYLQDLLGKRAGAGASLLALQRLSADGLAALIFAAGAAMSGYGLVMVIGAIVTVMAMVAILWLDRTQADPI